MILQIRKLSNSVMLHHLLISPNQYHKIVVKKSFNQPRKTHIKLINRQRLQRANYLFSYRRNIEIQLSHGTSFSFKFWSSAETVYCVPSLSSPL
jgi:hypothetical protein